MLIGSVLVPGDDQSWPSQVTRTTGRARERSTLKELDTLKISTGASTDNIVSQGWRARSQRRDVRTCNILGLVDLYYVTPLLWNKPVRRHLVLRTSSLYKAVRMATFPDGIIGGESLMLTAILAVILVPSHNISLHFDIFFHWFFTYWTYLLLTSLYSITSCQIDHWCSTDAWATCSPCFQGLCHGIPINPCLTLPWEAH